MPNLKIAFDQPWWLLQNMSGFGGPLPQHVIDEHAAVGRKIADRLRELGMTPVLPGYFGTVPPGCLCVQATRRREFPGVEFGLPCLLVLRRVEPGDREHLNEILRETGVNVG